MKQGPVHISAGISPEKLQLFSAAFEIMREEHKHKKKKFEEKTPLHMTL